MGIRCSKVTGSEKERRENGLVMFKLATRAERIKDENMFIPETVFPHSLIQVQM